MSDPRRFTLALTLTLYLAMTGAAGSVGGAMGGADGALSDEDIVRGFVTGKSASDLIELINTSEVDFDVSRDMLDELRAAGLPSAVIEAMKRRQAEVDAAKRPAEVAAPEEPTSTFAVMLNPVAEQAPDAPDTPDGQDEEEPVLRYLDVVPASVVETLRLGAEDRRFTDISIFLGCTRVQHVPDHWRSKTPLGRDFVSVPRHRLLAWVSGARVMEKDRKGKFLGKLAAGSKLADAAILELDVPERLDATLEPDETHDLILGVALEAGGRFYMFTADVWNDVSIDPTAGLSATLKGGESARIPEAVIRFHR